MGRGNQMLRLALLADRRPNYQKTVLRYKKRVGEDSLINANHKKHQPYELDDLNYTHEEIYQKNSSMLSVILLLYIFSNDDGAISRKENRKIKKFMKIEEKHFNKNDMRKIIELSNRSFSQEALNEYIDVNQIKKPMVEEVIKKLKEYVDKKYVYYQQLNKVSSLLFPNN